MTNPRGAKKQTKTSGQTTLAIDVETRNALNEFVLKYNEQKGKNDKELTAKNFIGEALDYFKRNHIDFSSDVVAPQTTTIVEQRNDEMERVLQVLSAMISRQDKFEQALLQIAKNTERKQRKQLEAPKQEHPTNRPKIDLETMGEVLKVWRIKNNLSKYAVAKQTGLHTNVVTNIEQGKDVSLASFLKYASMFLCVVNTEEHFDVMKYFEVYRGGLSSANSKEREQILKERETYLNKE